ncbi:hypothetical protein VTN02DRAFT_5788 [Thermoascus thermophilus]
MSYAALNGRADQRSLLNYLPSSLAAPLRQVYLRRPRTRRSKLLFLASATCLFVFLLMSRGSDQSQYQYPLTYNYWTEHPSYYPASQRPEDSAILAPTEPSIGENGTLPSGLQKSNPAFHVLMPATEKNAHLCRAVTSGMILNYPPPTLIGYGKEFHGTEYDTMAARVKGINRYLKNSKHLKDDDLVLIVDGFDVIFQLPAEVMIRRFRDLLRETNERLRRKYGVVVVSSQDGEKKELVQKYTQRVLFSASKICYPNTPDDVGCVTVPKSTLAPDIYGPKTDMHPDGHLNRPRWIHSGAVIGQVSDLKLIYAQVADAIGHRRHKHGDQLALGQIYGKQEYVRELERRRTHSGWSEWLWDKLGISEASNLTGIYVPLEPGRRYEYGIGVDYESRLFFNMLHSRNDVEWLEYSNVTKASRVQQEHGVPRERRLTLPKDIEQHAQNPFIVPKVMEGDVIKPPYNASLDHLPDPKNCSWNDLPLMTNVHSTSVPALVHLNDDKALRNPWWSNMWYHQWARALLRKYMRAPRSRIAAQSSFLGGYDWWDMRGGEGGVWTDNDEWLEWEELCEGYEEEIFGDGLGEWGKEDGGQYEKPVYNQWGILIAGKGPPTIDVQQQQQ